MHHTIITFDLASFNKLGTERLQWLISLLNNEIGYSKPGQDLDLDEWKTTVVQVSPQGERTPVPGYRFPEGEQS